MTVWQWLSLAGLCLAGASSPGPSLMVVFGASLGGGSSAGLVAAWAHALGVVLYALFTVLGVSALVAAMPALFVSIQIAGALYLLYLASKLLRSSGSALANASHTQSSFREAAIDGFSVAFLNPKLALFMLALFSQFLRPEFGAAELAVMVATAGIVDGLWYSAIALLLTRERWLEALQRRAAFFDRTFGVLILLLALYILWEAARRYLAV